MSTTIVFRTNEKKVSGGGRSPARTVATTAWTATASANGQTRIEYLSRNTAQLMAGGFEMDAIGVPFDRFLEMTSQGGTVDLRAHQGRLADHEDGIED